MTLLQRMAKVARRRSRSLLPILGALLGIVSVAVGQEDKAPTRMDPSKLPEFEVASVKPADPKGAVIGLFTYPGGRIVASQMPLRQLIVEALNLQEWQISGGQELVSSNWFAARFDIEARPPRSSASSKSNPSSFKLPPNDEQRQMLLALLMDRFQLRFHREIREGSVYFLVKGNNGMKIQATKDTKAFPWVGGVEGGAIAWGTGIAGENITMPLLAKRLSDYLKRPIFDGTGLDGAYDFEYRTGDEDPNAEVTSSILTSLQKLGFKLVPGKGPVEIIVIDRVEKLAAN